MVNRAVPRDLYRGINHNLRVLDPRQVTLLCSRKEKSPKESAPPRARRRASQAFGVKPVRGADRTSAPDIGHMDVPYVGEGPKPEKRGRRWRHRGCPSLWVLSLGQARESTPTAVREPQVENITSTDRALARTNLKETVAAQGATNFVAPVQRRECTLSTFAKTPPHPAFAGMTA